MGKTKEKTKVDSHSWKTRVTSGVSLIASGTLESRKNFSEGYGREETGKMKGKICLLLLSLVWVVGLCFFFFFFLHLH